MPATAAPTTCSSARATSRRTSGRGSTSRPAASSRNGAPATPGTRARSSARRRTRPIRPTAAPPTTASQWDAFRESVGASLADANRRFAPLRMARNYSFVRVDVPFGKNDVEAITLTNLRDRSSIARLTLTRKLRPNLSVYAIETEFLGAAGSELAYIQVKRLTTFGARVYF